jgi:hypothetical protein
MEMGRGAGSDRILFGDAGAIAREDTPALRPFAVPGDPDDSARIKERRDQLADKLKRLGHEAEADQMIGFFDEFADLSNVELETVAALAPAERPESGAADFVIAGGRERAVEIMGRFEEWGARMESELDRPGVFDDAIRIFEDFTEAADAVREGLCGEGRST